jgi:hypothetical protein
MKFTYSTEQRTCNARNQDFVPCNPYCPKFGCKEDNLLLHWLRVRCDYICVDLFMLQSTTRTTKRGSSEKYCLSEVLMQRRHCLALNKRATNTICGGCVGRIVPSILLEQHARFVDMRPTSRTYFLTWCSRNSCECLVYDVINKPHSRQA